MRPPTLPCPLGYRRWRACSGSIWCDLRSCESFKLTTKDSPPENSLSASTYRARRWSGIYAPSKRKTWCTRTHRTGEEIEFNTRPIALSSPSPLTTSARTFSLPTEATEGTSGTSSISPRPRVAIFEIAVGGYGGAMAGRKEIPDRAKKPIALRLRTPVDAVVKARADKLGMPWGEYCSYLIANAVDMPEFAPELPASDDPQEELPLKSA